MNIEHPPQIAIDEIRGENAHKAGQNHQIGLKAVNQVGECNVESFAGFKLLVIENLGGNIGVFGTLQSTSIGTVADDCGDFCIQYAIGYPINK